MAEKFDLMAAFSDRRIETETVDTKNRMKIVNIMLDNITPSAKNFYSIEDIDALAEDIKTNGLMHNLVVKEKADGGYELISGERRWHALKKLSAQGIKDFDVAPCVIKHYDDELQEEIALISANTKTRQLSDWESTQAVARMEQITLEMQRQGKRIPGRLNAYISKELSGGSEVKGLSATNVARHLRIIRCLHEDFKQIYKDKKINMSVAYELSGLVREKQCWALEWYRDHGRITLPDVEILKNVKTEEEERQELEAAGQQELISDESPEPTVKAEDESEEPVAEEPAIKYQEPNDAVPAAEEYTEENNADDMASKKPAVQVQDTRLKIEITRAYMRIMEEIAANPKIYVGFYRTSFTEDVRKAYSKYGKKLVKIIQKDMEDEWRAQQAQGGDCK